MTLRRNGSTSSSTESRKLLVMCTSTLGEVLDALYKVNAQNQKEDTDNPGNFLFKELVELNWIKYHQNNDRLLANIVTFQMFQKYRN